MEAKTVTKQDEIISYLMNSKRELQQEIKNDIHKPEFLEALKKLRDRKKSINGL